MATMKIKVRVRRTTVEYAEVVVAENRRLDTLFVKTEEGKTKINPKRFPKMAERAIAIAQGSDTVWHTVSQETIDDPNQMFETNEIVEHTEAMDS